MFPTAGQFPAVLLRNSVTSSRFSQPLQLSLSPHSHQLPLLQLLPRAAPGGLLLITPRVGLTPPHPRYATNTEAPGRAPSLSTKPRAHQHVHPLRAHSHFSGGLRASGWVWVVGPHLPPLPCARPAGQRRRQAVLEPARLRRPVQLPDKWVSPSKWQLARVKSPLVTGPYITPLFQALHFVFSL